MTDAPLVSVIVPAYNAEKFLGAALQSIFEQDYPATEVIVVDDGSTDRTRDTALRFPSAFVLHQANGGAGSARNTGLDASSGELLTFLDADDVMLPGKISAQVTYLADNPQVGCVLTAQDIFVHEGVKPPPWVKRTLESPHRDYPPMSAMVRRSVYEMIGGFLQATAPGEDLDWLVRMRHAGVKIATISRPFVQRRIHGGNLTMDQDSMVTAMFKVFRSQADRRRDSNLGS